MRGPRAARNVTPIPPPPAAIVFGYRDVDDELLVYPKSPSFWSPPPSSFSLELAEGEGKEKEIVDLLCLYVEKRLISSSNFAIKKPAPATAATTVSMSTLRRS